MRTATLLSVLMTLSSCRMDVEDLGGPNDPPDGGEGSSSGPPDFGLADFGPADFGPSDSGPSDLDLGSPSPCFSTTEPAPRPIGDVSLCSGRPDTTFLQSPRASAFGEWAAREISGGEVARRPLYLTTREDTCLIHRLLPETEIFETFDDRQPFALVLGAPGALAALRERGGCLEGLLGMRYETTRFGNEPALEVHVEARVDPGWLLEQLERLEGVTLVVRPLVLGPGGIEACIFARGDERFYRLSMPRPSILGLFARRYALFRAHAEGVELLALEDADAAEVPPAFDLPECR